MQYMLYLRNLQENIGVNILSSLRTLVWQNKCFGYLDLYIWYIV